MQKIDYLRLLAVLFIIAAVAHLYVFVFTPQIIPPYLKLGIPGRPLNILLIGKDLIYDEEKKIVPKFGNTDTLMIVHIDPTDNQALLYSIPRDTLVNIEPYGQRKINAAFNLGGSKLTEQVIKNLMAVRIDGYLEVNTNFLIEAIDLIGGIKVMVDKDMYYNDNAANLHIRLKEGEQNLNGKQAMDFLRFRLDPLGDMTRIERQQRFLKAFFSKLKQVKNLPRFPIILYSAYKNTQTDLSLSQLFRIANFLRGIKFEEIKNYTLEGTFGEIPGLGSVWIPNTENIHRFVGTNL